MANLGTWVVQFTGYKTLEEITGLTFTAGNIYQIQFVDCEARVRRGEVGKGFKIACAPFDWECGEDDLYIGNPYNRKLEINVDEIIKEA